MNKEELLQKLLDIYRGSCDIEEPYDIKGDVYDAYAFCDITNAKYVLVKKAELWRAICFEHIFFRLFDTITVEDISKFTESVVEQIEPSLVRKGEKYPVKDHMYSYVTGIFICENGVPEEVKHTIKKAHYYKNYRLSIRGYCEMRILAVDLKNHKLIGNRGARDLIKDYKRFV